MNIISIGPSCIRANCPEHKCKQLVPLSAFQKLVSTETYEKYHMYCIRNFIETSKTMRWCPAPGCNKVIVGSGNVM